MNAKLTLTIEQSVIEKAKIYAKSRGRSLSDIIESYLKCFHRLSQYFSWRVVRKKCVIKFNSKT
jgi:uncharacterized protein (DUF3820 family)